MRQSNLQQLGTEETAARVGFWSAFLPTVMARNTLEEPLGVGAFSLLAGAAGAFGAFVLNNAAPKAARPFVSGGIALLGVGLSVRKIYRLRRDRSQRSQDRAVETREMSWGPILEQPDCEL